MKNRPYLHKKCRLTYLTGFVIEGTVADADNNGIIFNTTTQTSFISWASIRDIKILDGDY